MAVFLSLETTSSGCSAALHENDSLLMGHLVDTPYSAAAQLILLVDRLFSEAGFSKSRIDAVAISAGPGSYTGLRIGAATAKAICFALDRPLIGIDSLQVLAAGLQKPESDNHLLCPMIDARRMEVYTSLLTPGLDVVEASHPRVVDTESFNAWLAGRSVLYFGSGAEKCQVELKESLATYVPGISGQASNMGKLAWAKFRVGDFEDVGSFEPKYLKEFAIKTKSDRNLL